MPWHMALVLSAKARRNLSQNERLWQTLDIGNVFGPTISNFNLWNKITKIVAYKIR